MEQNYDKKCWDTKTCPKVDCKKDACNCGLKKVFLPASLGDDSASSPIAPQNGAYCNAIVVYENNGHIYIYTAEGVPVLVDSNSGDLERRVGIIERTLATEISERRSGQQNLQNQIDALKNNPDVVDIVNTYQDLQSYDTSKITDNDIIRVLNDETHDGYSTYYRYNASTQSWTYVGKVDAFVFEEFIFTMLDNTTVTKKFAVFNQGA
jgi:hypothetical protein